MIIVKHHKTLLFITSRDRHPAGMRTRLDPAEIGERLRITREALGLTGTEFAKDAGVLQNGYSQYETGIRRLTLPAANRLCERHGLTMDWLFRGDVSTLPHVLASKIAAQLGGHSAPPPVPLKPRRGRPSKTKSADTGG